MPAEWGRPVSEVLHDIVENLQDIIRSELRLAAVETKQELSKGALAGKALGAGALLGFFALAFLLFSGVFALALVVPLWAAFLIGSITLAIVASIFVSTGKKRMKLVHPRPEKTLASIRETLHG